MFRYTSSFDHRLQEFSNRDALLLALESEENRSLQLNITTTVSLAHVDQEGNVLEQAELTFPMPNNQTYQEALADFGQTVAPRKPLLGIKLSTSKSSKETPNPAPPLAQMLTRLLNILKNIVLLLSLILAGLSFLVSVKLNQTVKALKEQPRQVKHVQTPQVSDEHAVDVFSRYFLGAYFSQSGKMEAYVAPDIEKSKLKTAKLTPSSVLLEAIRQEKGELRVTYVCSFKDHRNHIKTKRVTFTVKADKSADYRYIVTKAPKLTNYPK